MKQYDAIVIGAGQAGPSLAARLTQEGLKTAIVERKLFGGTCVNTGCIPTKTLVASARAAYMAKKSSEFGVNISGEIGVDMVAVKARKDAVVHQSNSGVTNWLKKMKNLDVYEGHASFVDNHSIQVNAEILKADKIFINVGARARIPDLQGLKQIDYFTNSNFVDVDFLPEHLVIVGGSYIGLEFAQMYRRFGSQVTVIEMSEHLLPREDEDISASIKEILELEGVKFRLGAECIAFEKRGNAVAVNVSCSADDKEIIGTHVLLAVGRTPNTDALGIENCNIELDERGLIKVDDYLQTNIPGVWALGEVNGKGAFTHTSYNDYEVVVDQLFESQTRSVSKRIPCYGLFIDPPLGRVGLTEAQAKQSDRHVLIGKMPMTAVGRARERGETLGFMKVLIDADNEQILGAAFLGISADEVVHLLIDAMYARMSYKVIKNAMHIHPTVAELIPTLLQDLKELR